MLNVKMTVSERLSIQIIYSACRKTIFRYFLANWNRFQTLLLRNPQSNTHKIH